MLNFPTHHRSPHLLSALVVDHHNQPLEAIAGRDPLPAVSVARQDLIVLLLDHTGLTQAEIGAALNRTESTVSHILRVGKQLAISDAETSRRMALLRAAALSLPTEVDLLDDGPQSPDQLARRVISRGAATDTLLDRMSIAIITSSEVLRTRAVTDGEARRAALSLLTEIMPVVPSPAQIIPLKGTMQ